MVWCMYRDRLSLIIPDQVSPVKPVVLIKPTRQTLCANVSVFHYGERAWRALGLSCSTFCPTAISVWAGRVIIAEWVFMQQHSFLEVMFWLNLCLLLPSDIPLPSFCPFTTSVDLVYFWSPRMLSLGLSTIFAILYANNAKSGPLLLKRVVIHKDVQSLEALFLSKTS